MYAIGRDGKAFYNFPQSFDEQKDLTPLFETILKEIENSDKDEEKPFQMLISTLDFDNHVGKICIGKITQGTLNKGQSVALVDEDKVLGTYKVQKLFTSIGLERKEVETVAAGDIIGIAGIPQLTIGQTVTDVKHPVSLPKITVEEPTIKVTIGPNTSPFLGKEGKFASSNQIKDRLLREKEINVGLTIEQDIKTANFVVAGRGELHLAVLIETMRREGYEFEVSKPQVLYKKVDKQTYEPFEEVTLDAGTEFIGEVTEEMSKRKAELQTMHPVTDTTTRFVYKISSQNLLGARNILLTKTKGTLVMSTYSLGYFPLTSKLESLRNGVLISSEPGTTLSYGLANAQERGTLFVGPGIPIYEGMIVGIGTRENDIEVNVCKAKQLTNNRSQGEGVGVQLVPPVMLSLEQALDFINDDELLEVTPQNIRMRKKFLSATQRRVMERKQQSYQTV